MIFAGSNVDATLHPDKFLTTTQLCALKKRTGQILDKTQLCALKKKNRRTHPDHRSFSDSWGPQNDDLNNPKFTPLLFDWSVIQNWIGLHTVIK